MLNSYDATIADPEIFKTLSVKDLLFVHYICPQVDKQINAWTEYNLIGFTLSGKKTYHHNGKSWTLTHGSSIFVKKGAYTQEMYEFGGWEVLAFYIPDDYLKKVFNEYRSYLPLDDLPQSPLEPLLYLEVDDILTADFHSVIAYIKKDSPPPEDLLELKFRELLFNVYSIPANKNLLAYVSSLIDRQKIPLWQIMESNFMFNLTIAEYARMAQRSVSTFKREFKQIYKISPGRWLTQKRLENSRLLLETSYKTISEIAYENGFENTSHFSRVFKGKYNTSPLRYRQNFANESRHRSIA